MACNFAAIAYVRQAKEQYPCFESQDETLESMLKQQLKKASKVRNLRFLSDFHH